MKTIILTIILAANVNTAFTQPSTAKTNTQSIENIKAPHFTDPMLQTFFSTYLETLGNYLKAVRQNNKVAIRKEFDLNVQYGETTYTQLQRASTLGPEEHRKALEFVKQLRPIIKEISNHPYVKELSLAYLKTHPQ